MGPTVTGPGSVLREASLLVSTPVSMGAVEPLSESLEVGSGPDAEASLVVEDPGALVPSVLTPPVVDAFVGAVVAAEVFDPPPPVALAPPPVVAGDVVGPDVIGAGVTAVT